MLLTLALTHVLALPALPAPQSRKDLSTPPGMVHVPGGRTWIGSTKKQIEELMTEIEAARGNVRALDGETGLKQRMEVGSFFMLVNELTNEQYKPFIEATGHRPPFTWGEGALDKARLAFLEAENTKRQEVKAAGKKYTTKKFDTAAQEKWWSANWKGAEWKMPDELALVPVTYVDYADALAYCQWAGLRLPTEFEYQRAARGDSKHIYPWGDDFEIGLAATNELRKDEAQPVGSFEQGVSSSKIYDLAGNVWEWTTSPYVAFPHFKKNEYIVGKRRDRETLNPEPTWDANKKVAVGGSFQNSKVAARVAVRRPTERIQMTNAVGFRPVATPRVGIDIARSVELVHVRDSEARPDLVDYLPDQVVAMDMWEKSPSAAQPKIADYSVITDYHFLAFVPVQKLEQRDKGVLDRQSLTAPVHLGFLTTNQRLLDPELPPGTYLIAYRSKGQKPRAEEQEGEDAGADRGEEAEEPEIEANAIETLIDITRDNLMFFDARTGELAIAIEPTGNTLKFGKVKDAGKLAFEDKQVWETIDGEQVQKTEKWLAVRAHVQSLNQKQPLILQLSLKLEPAATRRPWRMAK